MEKKLNLKEGILSSVAKWVAGVHCIGYDTASHKRGKPAAIWKLHTGAGPVPADVKRPAKQTIPRPLPVRSTSR